jgi:ribosomal protein S18 acetylase RimI-like enzyme
MTGTCIVPATTADIAAISELAAVIWRACYPAIITREQIDYMLAKMYSPEMLRNDLQNNVRYERLLVGDEFVGFASFSATEQTDLFKLHKLYLHPDEQGRGLGSLLLKHCENEVRKLGARRLVLNVNKHNAPAIAVYQKNGFAVVKSVVADIGGGFVMDDFIMAKDLI